MENMDILSLLPEDVFNEVVSYLSAKDILKATMVCKGWNQMIERSSDCMQKIAVKFNATNCIKDQSSLLNINRKYQNIIIGFEERLLQASGIEPKIKAILKKFAKTIVKLETSHDFQRICELPKLKELRYKNWHYRADKKMSNTYFCSNGLIANCPNIKSLDISTRELDDKYVRILHGAIKDMRNLKSLAINQIALLYDLPVTECQFRLEKLEIGNYFNYLPNHPILRNARAGYEFMMHHRSTLKHLRIKMLSFEDIVFILSELPKLHTLHIDQLDYPIKEGTIIPENSTIKRLFITSIINFGQKRQKLAEVFTNLKRLHHIKFLVLHSRFIPALFDCQSLALVEYRVLSSLVTEEQRNFMATNGNIKFIQIQ